MFRGYISFIIEDVTTVTSAKAKYATQAAALVAAELAAYEDYVTDNPVEPEEKEGQTYELTSGTDKGADFTGTDNKDFFDASIVQNSFTGGVSNSLSSADKLDGGAGTDTLHAEIVPEFFAATGDNQIDIQPKTKSIEIVTFEARDAGSNAGVTDSGINNNTIVTVDAKNMTGVQKIGSKFSDGDLIIENLTTLDDNGAIRHTSDMTITMDHTDSFNSDSDASDLKVYFDEDYLNTDTIPTGSTLTLKISNVLNMENGENPVAGFDKVNFMVGETAVAVVVSAVTSYEDVRDAINAKLVELGLDTVTATLGTVENAVWSQTTTIDGVTYAAGDVAGQLSPVVISNTGTQTLVKGEVTVAEGGDEGDINKSWQSSDSVEITQPISINVELHKVGRDGDGGNLIIGGKDTTGPNKDVDQNDGIEQFDITVLGGEAKPSNLGFITSTNGFLKTVNISSDNLGEKGYAALTVRGEGTVNPFGGTLDTFNANGFLGDLTIGNETSAKDINTFTATGGGDVTLYETITTDVTASVTTGAGVDDINITNAGSVTIATGSANDTIVVNMTNATTDSATINAGDNDDTVTVTGGILDTAKIDGGDGADTIYGNNVTVTVEAGSGNDTVYAENTGATKAAIAVDAGDVTALLATQAVNGNKTTNVIDETELLYGRTVTVTLATLGLANAAALTSGFESAAINIVASNGYLTTELDLYTAIAKAINDDAVLSKLAEATIDSNGDLTVQYLVDGALVNSGDLGIEYTISAPAHLVGSTTILGITDALKEKFSDSGISANTVKTAYDNIGVAADTDDLTDTFAITNSGDNSSDDTDNVINGGLGDDVIVLSTSADSNDTIVIDGLFGNDTIVHFTAGAAANEDYLDFTGVLNGQFFAGTSTSEDSKNHFDNNLTTDSDLSFNEIIVFNSNTLNFGTDSATQDTWAELTGNILFNAIKDTGTVNFAGITSTTLDLDTLANINSEIVTETGVNNSTLVGTTVKNIVMIENNLNLGEYKVFELTGTVNATTNEFTSATLLGTLDFGETQTFTADNIIA